MVELSILVTTRHVQWLEWETFRSTCLMVLFGLFLMFGIFLHFIKVFYHLENVTNKGLGVDEKRASMLRIFGVDERRASRSI